MRRLDLVPVHQDERKRQGCQDPPDRAPHAHRAELLLRIFNMRKGDRVHDRKRGNIKQAMHPHQDEKRPEMSRERTAENSQTSYQMAEGKKPLSREIAVGKLIAEKDPNDGRDGESVQDPRLLAGVNPKL